MIHRCLASMAALAVVLLAPLPVAGQAPSSATKTTAAAKAWTPPRTPDGQPDLQGVWDYRTITPLERPIALGEKQVFTDEEAANFEREENRRQNRDLVDPKRGGAGYPPASDGGVVPYNEFWYDRGNKVIGTKRTSLIAHPPNGRIPPLTPEAQKRAAARAEARGRRGPADSYEDLPMQLRCIMWGTAGPPMLPSAYNNNVQLFQTAGYVAIFNEMIHDHRIVPLDGRPHGTIRQLMGDSRGHWEGNTLVVDTINFTDRWNFRGSSEKMHLVERFTRVGPDTLLYEFTVDDPGTFTEPWTAALPMTKSQEHIYEYACHEGNYSIVNVLSGARAQEKAAAEAAKKGSR